MEQEQGLQYQVQEPGTAPASADGAGWGWDLGGSHPSTEASHRLSKVFVGEGPLRSSLACPPTPRTG